MNPKTLFSNAVKNTGYIGLIHWLFLASVYGIYFCKAFLEFRPDWDYMTYHLPDALSYFHLTTYVVADHLRDVNLGMPPLAHMIQGLLVFLTGSIPASKGSGVVGFSFLLGGIFLLFRFQFSWRFFLTSCLAIPLFNFHISSGYIDLFLGSMLALSFAGLVKVERQWSRERTISCAGIWCCCLGSIAAIFAKYQGWPIAWILAFVLSARLLVQYRAAAITLKKVLIVWIVLVSAILFWPVRNIILFDNPTYPFETPIVSEYFTHFNYPFIDTDIVETPRQLLNRPLWIQFIYSVFELTRWQTSEPMGWSLGQYDKGDGTWHQRMGGWFVVTFSLVIVVWIALSLQRKIPCSVNLTLLLLILVNANLPRCHELRYFLYLPLSLLVLISEATLSVSRRWRDCTLIFMCITAIYVVKTVRQLSIDTRPVSAHAPPEAVEFWQERWAQGYSAKDGKVFQIKRRRNLTLYWAGPTFNEFRIEAIKGDG